MRVALILGAFIFAGAARAERLLEGPKRVGATALAIVVDEATWRVARAEIEAYRAAVEADGIGTWLAVDAWIRPEDVRELLARLAAQAAPIEGAWLVGNVPIARLNRAEILSSRCALDEGASAGEPGLIVSDLIYQDFRLRFDALGQTRNVSHCFDYEIDAEGPQRVRKTIYTARLLAPDHAVGGRVQRTNWNEAEGIREFLSTCVAAKKKSLPLVRLVCSGGEGSAFASLVRARGEVFPRLEEPGGRIVDVVMNYISKLRVPVELADSTTDLAVLSLMVFGGHDFDGTAVRARAVILEDGTQGRFTDEACAAQAIVFGGGSNQCCVASTIDGRFDPFEDGSTGLLALGVSFGQWLVRCPLVDVELFGDPTFGFASSVRPASLQDPFTDARLAEEAVTAMLAGTTPPTLRSIAVPIAAGRRGAAFEDELLRFVRTDPASVVRLRALEALARLRTKAFDSALMSASVDPSERIRRAVAGWMGDVGKVEYLPRLLDLFLDRSSPQAANRARASLMRYDPDTLKPAIDDYARSHGELATRRSLESSAQGILDDAKRVLDPELKRMVDPKADPERRSASIRMLRVARPHRAIAPLLGIVSTQDDNESVRAAASEALGWFFFCAARETILARLGTIENDAGTPMSVKREVQRTRTRLAEGPNSPLEY